MLEETFTIEALVESNEMLQEEVTRLRNSNRICRTVIRALRATVTSQRSTLELAQYNDETFKSFCAGDFDPVTPATPAVEPVSDATGTV